MQRVTPDCILLRYYKDGRMTLVKPLKIERHSNTATRCGFMVIDRFLKINDDFLTKSDTKHYSRFNITWVLIYKRTSNEPNIETNVTKCYGHDQA